MKCILCKSEEVNLVFKDYISKIKDLTYTFDVYVCSKCGVRFVTPYEVLKGYYENVYAKFDWYKASRDFLGTFQNAEDIWWALIGKGPPYYAVFDCVKHKENLSILDVGCGYGYTVIALAALGHEVTGIEVTDDPFKPLANSYGFYKMDIYEVAQLGKKFDLVYSTEVLEHLGDPLDFIKAGISLLKENGALLLTTPNKAYYEFYNGFKDVWPGEQPPIHLAYYSKESIEYIAKLNGWKVEFTDFPGQPICHTLAFTLKK